MEVLHHIASLYHSFSHLKHTFGDAHDEMQSSVFARVCTTILPQAPGSTQPSAVSDTSQAIETVEFLRLKLPEHLAKPRVAIVCGSGLGGLAQTVNEETEEWAYKDVPNFPLSTGTFIMF